MKRTSNLTRWIGIAFVSGIAAVSAVEKSSDGKSVTPKAEAKPSPSPSPSASPSPSPSPTGEPLVDLDLSAVEDATLKPEIFEPQKEKRPQDLSFIDDKIQVSVEKKKVYVTVPIAFARENWELASGMGQEISPYSDSKNHGYQVRVEIKKAVTPMPLALVSPKGEVENYPVELRFSNWEAALSGGGPRKYKRLSAQARLDTSLLLFNDSRFSPTSIIALTVRGSATFYFVPPRWDVTVAGFINALPVYAADSTSYIRLLGVQARVGYKIPRPRSPWQLSAAAGYYYMTMIVPSADRGVINLNGPLLYPTLSYFFANGNSASLFLRYSPMFSGFSFLALTNFEVAGGLTYSWKLKNNHPLSAHFDFSTFAITLQSIRVATTSFSLGASYGF